MSTDTVPDVPSVEEAYATIFDVHKRAFFHRLSQYQIVPTTEKEAEELLDMGAKLAQLSANPAIQKAAESQSRFSGAAAALDEALTDRGMMAPAAKQAQAGDGVSPEAGAAAWELAQHPEVLKSAEVLMATAEEGSPAAG